MQQPRQTKHMFQMFQTNHSGTFSQIRLQKNGNEERETQKLPKTMILRAPLLTAVLPKKKSIMRGGADDSIGPYGPRGRMSCLPQP